VRGQSPFTRTRKVCNISAQMNCKDTISVSSVIVTDRQWKKSLPDTRQFLFDYLVNSSKEGDQLPSHASGRIVSKYSYKSFISYILQLFDQHNAKGPINNIAPINSTHDGIVNNPIQQIQNTTRRRF